MKLTLPQLRKLVESTVKDVMKSKKKSLKEGKEPDGCPKCGADFASLENLGRGDYSCFECDYSWSMGEENSNTCDRCGSIYVDTDGSCRDCDEMEEEELSPSGRQSLHRPDFKVGGMKASLDRHVKESRMRTRRR